MPAAHTNLNGGSTTLDISRVCLSLGFISLMGTGMVVVVDRASKGAVILARASGMTAILARESGWNSEAGADSLLDSGTGTD